MHKFNFDRALVLDTVEKLPDGNIKVKTMFNGSAILPRSLVRLTTTRHLNDMSTRVVDFGRLKKGQQPAAAIIAAGRKDRLPQL